MNLRLRLQRAKARRDAEPAFSPDWDAAMAEVDCVISRIWRHVPERKWPTAADPRSMVAAGR